MIANRATTVPDIAPRPPKISVPPRTTAVIASSSRPRPTLEIVDPKRDVIITAQIPATVPLNANAMSRTLSTLIPEKLLEEGLLPGGGIALLEAREGITQTKTDGEDFNLGRLINKA